MPTARRMPAMVPVAIATMVLLVAWRLVIGLTVLPVSFDEAQYWLWAQAPAFGYFSKPPVVAWAIAATTAVCGDGPVCVKLSAPLAHLVAAAGIWTCGARLRGPLVGAWAALLYISLPGVAFSSKLVTTDPFLLAAWAWALAAAIAAVRQGGIWRWALVGGLLGVGMLAKYAMVAFVLSAAIAMIWLPAWRRAAGTAGPWIALAVMAVVFAPNVWWNAANHFVSFVHTGDNANIGGAAFNPLKALEFFGAQAGVFGPIPFAALLVVVARRRWREEPADGVPGSAADVRLLLAFTLPLIVIMTVQGFISRAHANWAAPAYVAGSVLVAAWLTQRPGRRWWLSAAVALHLSAQVAGDGWLVLVGQVWQVENGAPGATVVAVERADTGPSSTYGAVFRRLDPARRVRGWPEIGRDLSAIIAEQGVPLLFDERKVMASLVYFVRPHPVAARRWNPDPVINDHYDLTLSLSDAELGADLLLVTRRPDPGHVEAAFETVVKVAELRPRGLGRSHHVHLFRVTAFKGYDALPSGLRD